MSSSRNSTMEYFINLTNEIRFIFGLFNLISGLISNLSLIIILTNLKIFRKIPASFYLIIESYSNIGLLLFVCSSRILRNILNDDPAILSLQWCKNLTGFSQFFGLFSLFTICFTTIDQYFSTNYHYSIRQLSTMKFAYLFLIINFFVSLIHGFIFYIYSEVRQFPLGCSVYDEFIKQYLSYFYYPILSNALPVVITITVSLLSYRNVRRIIRRQIPVQRRKLDQQLTAMILIRVLSLIICGIPYIIISLYQLNMFNNENDDLTPTIIVFIGAIFNSLLYTNFSINFYLFLIISPRFRHQVKSFIRKVCRHLFNFLCTNQITPQTDARPISVVISV